MQATPPFRILALSNEFCIGALQDTSDCESVQFVSGLEAVEAVEAVAPAGDNGTRVRPLRPEQLRRAALAARAGRRARWTRARLLLSFGVNDCEAKLAQLDLERVWQMPKPLGQVRDAACVLD